MGHFHAFPSADTARPLNWHDLLGIARQHPAFAAAAVNELRERAQAMADRKGVPSDPTNKLIADAAQGWLDCPCDDCLDEIDQLLNPEPDELTQAWAQSDRTLARAGYRAGRGW